MECPSCHSDTPVDERELAALVQHEGAGRRLFTAEELATAPRVAPWDLAAVLMHARRRELFAPPLPEAPRSR